MSKQMEDLSSGQSAMRKWSQSRAMSKQMEDLSSDIGQSVIDKRNIRDLLSGTGKNKSAMSKTKPEDDIITDAPSKQKHFEQ